MNKNSQQGIASLNRQSPVFSLLPNKQPFFDVRMDVFFPLLLQRKPAKTNLIDNLLSAAGFLFLEMDVLLFYTFLSDSPKNGNLFLVIFVILSEFFRF